MSLPIVVTHPSTLLHNGLRRLFAKSRFRPIKIATSLTQELQDYLGSVESGVWLTGVERCVATTDALVRKVVAANPRVKAVIMTASQEPEHIVAALEAGACGFLSQDIAADTLLRSLELIAHCEMIVHPRLTSNHLAFDVDDKATHLTVLPRSPLAAVRLREHADNQTSDVPCLSRREMLILRLLMQGASNKTIARNLVITESTVKVHMKAILRKLRLQNRTQAAIWARNNVNDNDWNKQTDSASAAH